MNTAGISAVAALAVAGGTFVHATRGITELKSEVDALKRAVDTVTASAAAAESAAMRSAASFKSLSQTASMAALTAIPTGEREKDMATCEEVAAAKAAVDRLSTAIAPAVKNVSKLETKAGAHDAAIDDIYTRLETTESKVSDYLQRLSRVEGLLNGIVAGLEKSGGKIALGSADSRRVLQKSRTCAAADGGLSGGLSGGISGLPLPSGDR